MVLISYGIASPDQLYYQREHKGCLRMNAVKITDGKMKYKVNFHAEIVIKGMINQKCIITRKNN